MRRIMAAAISAALSVTALFASPALASGDTWHVQAGYLSFDGSGPSGGGNRFYPAAVSIHQGDSVQFAMMGAHTITLNRPAGPLFILFGPINASPTAGTATTPGVPVNSGIIGDSPVPTSFTLTFASTLPAGTYHVICGLHIGMSETVNVLPAGATLPSTDADYAAARDAQLAADRAAQAEALSEATESGDEDGGATVLAGIGTKRTTALRFFPASITVHVGEKVTFLKTQDPTEPHTVTFGEEPADQLAQLLPRGGNTYSGTENISSGFLSTKAQDQYYQLAGTPLPVGLLKYKVTFTKVGDWTYICAIHDVIGMRGVVHVVR
jgi:plastocyanin